MRWTFWTDSTYNNTLHLRNIELFKKYIFEYYYIHIIVFKIYYAIYIKLNIIVNIERRLFLFLQNFQDLPPKHLEGKLQEKVTIMHRKFQQIITSI